MRITPPLPLPQHYHPLPQHHHPLPPITTHYHALPPITHPLPRITTHYQKSKHYRIKSDPQATNIAACSYCYCYWAYNTGLLLFIRAPVIAWRFFPGPWLEVGGCQRKLAKLAELSDNVSLGNRLNSVCHCHPLPPTAVVGRWGFYLKQMKAIRA
jgi:hypothetical protein